MTVVDAGGSEGPARLPEDVAWQELVPWLEQLPAGETARLRNNRSMEGSRGLRRLTGQKAEPPWGVKFTLFGSGQEEMRVGLEWRGVLVSSQTLTFSQPSGGSLWKQQLLFGPGEDDMSRGRERSASFWQENGDRRHISALSVRPWCRSRAVSSVLDGGVEMFVGEELGEEEEDEDRGVVGGSL